MSFILNKCNIIAGTTRTNGRVTGLKSKKRRNQSRGKINCSGNANCRGKIVHYGDGPFFGARR